ncbi:hypothetical protein I6A60_31255 [Frankia sp. AgB1.9]|uniref:hypothetical protein n=1 Tax=unclassified Frankia TaxID=2632575 RepID=UPI001931DE6C|nr:MULTISPECIES: hypothetical protein [unclassified Frankia]MBL7493893.1 hypothetical protein [Frankia sp. AgW1.1]MBL7552308.1 hypothetical protein [Frankia sp. AgB1.9]MBL7622061.1 hypothetical protein [Frankia sp. AgB1.8]
MTDEQRAALLRQMATSYASRENPRDRHVLVRLVGGEPMDGVICPTPEAALLVADAMELQPSDFLIVVAREM